MRALEAQLEFDYDCTLPMGKEWFSPRWLAKHWGRSVRHVLNLIDQGEIKEDVDLRSKGARRSCTNIPRQAILDFYDRRKRQHGAKERQ